MSGANNYPTFKSSSIEMLIDENYRVHDSISYDSYEIDMPGIGNLTCNSKLETKFTYSESPIEVPEKSEFEPYFGTESGPIEQEKTVITYLGEAFGPLMEQDAINADVNLKIDGKENSIDLALNLDTMDIDLSIDDRLDIRYVGSNAYVLLDNASFLVSKDELSDLLNTYLVGQGDLDFDLSSLISDPTIAKIIADMTLVKTDSMVVVNVPLDIGTVHINLNRDSEDHVTLRDIDASLDIEGKKIEATVSLPNERHNFREIPTDVREFHNLVSLVSSVDRIVSSKGIEGNLSLELPLNDELNLYIDGDYALRIPSKDEKSYELNLTFTFADKTFDLTLQGINNDVYLVYGENNFVVKTTIEEIVDTLKPVLEQLGVSFDSNLVKGLLENLDIDTVLGIVNVIFERVYTGDSSISVNLDNIGIKLIDGKNLKIDYFDGFKLSIEDLLYANIAPVTRIIEIPNYENTIGLDSIKTLVNKIVDLTSGQFDVVLDNLNIGEVNLTGKVKVDATDIKNLGLEGQAVVKYHEACVRFSFIYKDETVYAKLNDQFKIAIELSEVKNLCTKLGIDLNTIIPSNLDISGLPIIEILNSVELDNNGNLKLQADLTSLGISNIINVSLNDDNEIVIYDDANELIEATIKIEANNIVAPEDKDSYITFTKAIEELKKGLSLKADLISIKDMINLHNVEAMVNFDNGLNVMLKAKLNISLLGLININSEDLEIVVKDKIFYISIGNANYELTKNGLVEILAELKAKLGLDIDVEETSVLLDNILDLNLGALLNNDASSSQVNSEDVLNVVEQLLTTLKVTETTLDVKVNLDKLAGTKLGDLNLHLDTETNTIDVNLGKIISNGTIGYGMSAPFNAPKFDKYVTSDGTVNLVKTALNLVSKLLSSKLDYTFTMNEPLTVNLSDTESILVNSLSLALKGTGSSDVYTHIIANATYKNENIDINLIVKKGVIYLDLNGAKVSIKKSYLETFIKTLEKELSITSSTPSLQFPLVIDLDTIFTSMDEKNGIYNISLNLLNNNFTASLTLADNDITSLKVTPLTLEGVKLSNISLGVSNETVNESEVTVESYLDLNGLRNVNKKFMDSIKALIESKKYELKDTVVTINGVEINLTEVIVDIREATSKEDILSKLKASVVGSVTYEGNEYPFGVYVRDNFINASIGNGETLNVKLSFDEIEPLIREIEKKFNVTILPTTNKTFGVKEVLDIVSKLNSILTINTLTRDVLDIKLDLSSLGYEYEANVTYQVKTSEFGLNLNSKDQSLSLGTKLVTASKEASLVPTMTNVLGYKELVDYIDEFAYIYNNARKFEGTFNAIVDMNMLGTSLGDLSLDVTYQIDATDKFDFNLLINLDSKMFKGKVELSKIGQDFYMRLSEVTSKFTEAELKKLINTGIEKFVTDEASKIDAYALIDDVFNYIDLLDKGLDNLISNINPYNIYSDSTKVAKLDLKKVFDSIRVTKDDLKATVNFDELLASKNIAFGDIKLNLDRASSIVDLTTDTLALHLNYDESLKLEKIKPLEATTYVTYEDLNSILCKLNGLMKFVTEKQYSVNVGGKVTTDGKTSYEYSGAIAIDLSTIFDKYTSNLNKPVEEQVKLLFSDVAINLSDVTIKMFDTEGNATNTIVLDLIYRDDSFFIEYNNNLRACLSRVEAVTVIKYIYSIVKGSEANEDDLVIKILDYLGADGSIDGGIFDGVIGGGNETIPFKLDLNSLISAVDDKEGKLNISVDATQFYKLIYPELDMSDKGPVDIYLTSTVDDKITGFGLKNMYTSLNESFVIDTVFVREGDVDSEGKPLVLTTVPTIQNGENGTKMMNGHLINGNNLGDYYYVGNIVHLIEAFMNTANLREYHLKAKVNMNIIGIINFPITADIRISLDEKSIPTVQVHFSVPWASAFIMYGGETDMFFRDGKLRLRNNYKGAFGGKNKVYMAYDTVEEINAHIADIINFILQSVSIKETIKNSVNTTKPNIELENFIKTYSYNYDEKTSAGTTVTTLAANMLMSSLGDLKLTLNDVKNLVTCEKDQRVIEGSFLNKVKFETSMTSLINIEGNAELAIEDMGKNANIDIATFNRAMANSNNW